MKSRRTRRFKRLFDALPQEVQEQARRAYRQLRDNPRHGSLRLKRVHPEEAIYSVRITRGYRALGKRARDGEGMLWFWIGSHADYERVLKTPPLE